MPADINDAQRGLFELARRYRILTPAIITSELCGGSENGTKKLIHGSRDFIVSDPLGQKGVYYRYNPAGAKFVGAPEEIARPLGPQALPKALGVLGFCCGGPIKRTRYTRHEFLEDFPELAGDLLGKDYHTDFFLDFDGTHARLGQIIVDLGGDFRKQLFKCRTRLREFLDVPHLRDVVSEGLFSIAIVVSEDEKAQAIRAAVAEKPLRARVIVETSAELQKCPLQIGVVE